MAGPRLLVHLVCTPFAGPMDQPQGGRLQGSNLPRADLVVGWKLLRCVRSAISLTCRGVSEREDELVALPGRLARSRNLVGLNPQNR